MLQEILNAFKKPDHEKKKQPHPETYQSNPPAGPHAKSHLIDPDKTPGAGTLASTHKKGEVDPGAG